MSKPKLCFIPRTMVDAIRNCDDSRNMTTLRYWATITGIGSGHLSKNQLITALHKWYAHNIDDLEKASFATADDLLREL